MESFSCQSFSTGYSNVFELPIEASAMLTCWLIGVDKVTRNGANDLQHRLDIYSTAVSSI